MKRFLSITLCVMMVASLFAVNVSAAIPTTYDTVEGATDEIVYINQDFSDATNTDFTKRNYDGVFEVGEDGILHLTGPSTTSQFSQVFASSAINSGEYVFEFDFMRNDDLKADYLIDVIFNRAANASSDNSELQRYGVKIPVRTVGQFTQTIEGVEVHYEDETNPAVDIEAKKWYNFRITVSESDFITAGGTSDKSDLVELVTVERKLATDSDWTTLSYTTSGNNFPANQVRQYGNDIANDNVTNYAETKLNPADKSEVILGINSCPNAQGLNPAAYVYDESQSKWVTSTEEAYAYTEDGTTADFQFDNIKAYVPADPGTVTAVNYPINTGIAMTDTAETTKTFESGTIYYTKDYTWSVEPTKYVATFDAVTTVAGGPLSFCAGGKDKAGEMVTINPGTTGQWYSYKIIYDNTGSSAVAEAVYRKAEGTSNWTLLTEAPSKSEIDGYGWWNGYNGSTTKNRVRWYLYGGQTGSNATSNCAAGTSWTVKNIQVTDGSAFTGTATAADGNLTVELNTELSSAADVIVAVYDGTKLANVSYAPVAITGNTATVTVPYATGNTVKLYAWDGIATGVPVLAAPITVTVQ